MEFRTEGQQGFPGIDAFVIDEPSIALAAWPAAATVTDLALRHDPGAILAAVQHELETIGRFAAATASLLNAMALRRGDGAALLAQLPPALPPEPKLLAAALVRLVESDLERSTVALLQDLTVRLAIARSLAMALTPNTMTASLRDLARDGWRRACQALLETIRVLRREAAAPSAPAGEAGKPATERLLAAAMLGGTPCVGPDGIVDIPGWLERRAEPRIVVNHHAILTLGVVSYPIIVRDISRSGAGLDNVPPIEAGSACILSLGASVVRGVIAWRGESRCGMRFDNHLADLDELLADIGHRV
ncbi:MAG: PilZ domain-containing protein [Hyphomicrobiaceae bacterium]